MSSLTLSLDSIEKYYSVGNLKSSERKKRKLIKKLLNKKDYAGALKLSDEYLQVHRGDGLVKFYRAIVLLGLGDGKKAMHALEELSLEVPSNTEVWRLLSHVYGMYRLVKKQIQAAEKITKLTPDSSSAWIALAEALGQAFWVEEQQQVLLRIVKLEPKNPNAWMRLSLAYYNCLKIKEAAAACLTALKLTDNNIKIRTRYALLLSDLGLFEQSDTELKGIIKEKIEGDVFWTLASRKHIRLGDKYYNKAVKEVERPDIDEVSRRSILYGLAIINEREKKYVTSADYYYRAGKEKTFDMAGFKELIDSNIQQIRNVFTSEFCRNIDGGAQSKAPIFIVGLPRCGSTLVEQIISSHSAVFGAGELSYISRLTVNVEEEHFYSQFSQMSSRQRSELGAQYLSLVRRLHSYTDRFTDKMLNNWQHVGFIKSILPNAKIVHVTRNTNASNFAMYKQYFRSSVPYSNSIEDIWWWRNRYENMMLFWEKRFPGLVYNVSYEDIITDIHSEARKLLCYLELPWEENVLEFYNNERSVATASVNQVRQKIYSSSLEAWRNYEGTVIDGLFNRPKIHNSS
ncbi:tetratricopeptide repeat-containing sulfotransferase family protein [Pseudovibrio denitrificans]|uniref:tetratricopeptide repeat-containing sulfotransferase family protein n=1 Tax=Pseudovibrio denitrificans TaxID=258256 RepID=UPI0039BF8869